MSVRQRVAIILDDETISAVAEHAAANQLGFDEAYEAVLDAGLCFLKPVPQYEQQTPAP